MTTNKDEISEYIRDIMMLTPEEDRADMAEYIATEAVIWGSHNVYEAVGILDVAKSEYFRVAKEVMLEEANCGCDACRCNEQTEIIFPTKLSDKDVN